MIVTLGQAAKLANRSKTALTKAIKTGRLSATRNDDGSYSVDVAELSRVFQIVTGEPETVELTGKGVSHSTPSGSQVTPTVDLSARLAAAEAELSGLKALLDEVKTSRDEWKEQAQRLALTGPAQRSFWKRLIG
jgi:hypothetical protein